MENPENYHKDPDENPPPPETAPGTADQPNFQSQLNGLSNEVIEPSLNHGKETREYMRSQLFEKLDATFANSRFNIIRRAENDTSTVGCRIYNQQNERLLTIFATANHVDQSYEFYDRRGLSITEVFDIYPPGGTKGKSERSYVREAAEKAAQAALKYAELIDAAIQKEKLDKKP